MIVPCIPIPAPPVHPICPRHRHASDFSSADRLRIQEKACLPGGHRHHRCGRERVGGGRGALLGFRLSRNRRARIITDATLCLLSVSDFYRVCRRIFGLRMALQAYWEAEQEAEAKRRAKRQEQVIKRWTKLVHGLRIRQRLLEQYADRAPGPGTEGRSGADVNADNQSAVEVRVFFVFSFPSLSAACALNLLDHRHAFTVLLPRAL